jgi:acyl carrier protein
VTAWQCRSDSDETSVPIGQPIDNICVHLLDSDLNRVPCGVPGDLYIGGIGLARGYLNNPARTADCFLPDPHTVSATAAVPAAPQLMYRSGDLARWRADGQIEYLGRRDHQIKLRGVRIEPGEIEAAIVAHPAVTAAHVTLADESGGVDRLIAYLVADEHSDEALEALQQMDWPTLLAESLPAVMIPAAYVALRELPLSVNGKIDRRRLPAPSTERITEFVAPRNSTEQVIADVWAEVLKVERIGVHDDFLRLGGHSLNATRVNTRLRKRLAVDLPLHAHFRFPVLEELATHIDAKRMATNLPTIPDEQPEQPKTSRQVEFEI